MRAVRQLSYGSSTKVLAQRKGCGMYTDLAITQLRRNHHFRLSFRWLARRIASVPLAEGYIVWHGE